ncbi:lactamase [Lyophyllum atratum]|nr:lactamase [Lyophyllum atratum]
MDQLEVLPSVSRLSDHVVRVLGQNPGKFTLQGTNTYIIGKENPYTLVDTGEGRDDYIPVLESALRETAKPCKPDEPDVSDIIISHWHKDHVGGLPSVLSLLRRLWIERNPSIPFRPPRLHKFPHKPNDPLKGHAASNSLPSLIASLPPDAFSPTSSGIPFHDLRDSQTFPTSGLRVLHTPGHTSDSICLYVPQDRALYTADTVLGQGTAIFEDLSAYLNSLNKMLNFNEGDGYTSLYPGHGPIVPNGKEMISGYIQHRLEREAQILKMLKTPPPPNPDSLDDSPTRWTTWTIVTTLYAAYPESLWLPAAHGVDLHLKKLEEDGVVKLVDGELQHTSWELVDILWSPPVDRASH